jgi:hypothetical protein
MDYEFTSDNIVIGPVNPAFHYSMGLSDFAPWFDLAVFVGPKEYDLGHLPANASLTFWSATPLNLGMIGYLDGRDSINYLWSNTEIDVHAVNAGAGWAHAHAQPTAAVPEPALLGLMVCALCALWWTRRYASAT